MRDPRRAAALLLLPLLGACVPAAPIPDLDGDGVVGKGDAAIIAACLGRDPVANPECAVADTNGDALVDGGDLFSLEADWGRRACNGAPALCARRFDQVSYPTSHNAFATWERFTLFFNQWDDMEAQLAHGIRGLMLDAWTFDADGNGTIAPGETFLCHADCAWARRPLDEGLAVIRDFLAAHPGQIVTLIFESYVAPADVAAAFDRVALTPYALAHAPGDPWPTLGEMVESGKRLVVLSDRTGAGSPPWYVNVWTVAFETHFTAATRADFSCSPNRGSPSNGLFILNHFLTRNAAVPGEAAVTNANPYLVERARQCWRERSRLPNFPTVDFATTGGVVAASRALDADFAAYGGTPPPAP